MKNEIRNEITWTTARGTELKVISGLNLSKTINADGHKVAVDCCDKTLRVEVNGKYHDVDEDDGLDTYGYPREVKGHTVLAAFGRMHLTDQADVDKIKAVIAKTELHPSWLAKQAKIEKNRKEISEMETRRTANGYCYKCGSYCYGDCEA